MSSLNPVRVVMLIDGVGIDLAMYEEQSGGNYSAGTALTGCLRVNADQISRFCLVVDEILEVMGLEDKYPRSYGEELKQLHQRDSGVVYDPMVICYDSLS